MVNRLIPYGLGATPSVDTVKSFPTMIGPPPPMTSSDTLKQHWANARYYELYLNFYDTVGDATLLGLAQGQAFAQDRNPVKVAGTLDRTHTSNTGGAHPSFQQLALYAGVGIGVLWLARRALRS